jgi:long-chain fatty acid transport protein
MELPAELAIGAAVHPFAALMLTSELGFVGWSTAKSIRYEIPGTPDGYEIPQGWKDSYSIAFGAEYRLSTVDLRAGLSYATSPVPNETSHPAFPDADRYAYSVGLGYRVGPGLMVDFAVAAFDFADREISDSSHEIVNEETGLPGQAFNGEYSISATSISISVSYLWR